LILADTSAWVELLRATGSAIHAELKRLIESGADVAVTEPVLMELYAGAGTDVEENLLREAMAPFPLVALDGLSDFELGARIYRACRSAGETLRGIQDCLIAAPAVRIGVPVLHADADFDTIARHASLRIHRGPTTAT
jgi:hypothetical protein